MTPRRTTLDEDERRLVGAIERGREELVELLSALVGFDTTARKSSEPARDERALQEYLAGRLEAVGAETDLWEPAPGDVDGSRMAPPGGVRFEGRPQLAARLPGAGGGRSLLLNGHVDVVSPEPAMEWSSPPRVLELRGGDLYGRGTCDMKGGVAAMVFAVEALATLGVRLAGDVVVCTVTDEESTGAGGLAAVAHGVRADAGIVPEPTGLDVWTACRGSLLPTVTVRGRAGHAGVGQPHWREGGAVNAIEKAGVVLAALRGLRDDWRARLEHRHPHLSPGDIVPTVISGGEWAVTIPDSCTVALHVQYLPAQADEHGWGTAVRDEVEAAIREAAAADDWLAEHPPEVAWSTEVPSAEVSPDHPLVRTLLSAGAALGLTTAVSGMDSWHDGATFTRFAGTPCACFGPGSLTVAHTVDEHVPVDELVACAQALAVTALRFCGRA